MAFKWTDLRVGISELTNIDDSAQVPVGTRARAYDSTQGPGEFIYLKGVASTAVGDVVVYDENFATTRAVAASRGPVAVAMAAVLANQYGWYQDRGVAVVNVLAGDVADAPQFLTATAGSIDDAVVAAQRLSGVMSMSAIGTPAAGQAYMQLVAPFADGGS